MLKETALSITPAVTELFNISIRLGELPNEWKVSRVSPIPKSDNHSDPGSYRPISLLSILIKLLEKRIRNILLAHFEEHHPISTKQWGVVVSSGGAPTPAGTSVFTKHNWDMGMGHLWLNGWGIYT